MQSVKFWKSPIGWAVGLGPAKSHRVKVGQGVKNEAIEFRLSNGAVKSGYRFHKRDPIWICEDDGNCPANKASHSQVSVDSCTDDCLTVTDKNSGDPVNLRYQLNLRDGSGNAVAIDPIIENGGSTLG